MSEFSKCLKYCLWHPEFLCVWVQWRTLKYVFFLKLRLEALHQILVLLSGMEEKGSISLAGSRLSSGFQSSTLLTSVRLQFLAGCFGLGTVGHTGSKGESGRLHHYQVGDTLQYIQILTVILQSHFNNVKLFGIYNSV